MAEITITKGTSIDLYAALNIGVGTAQLKIQNKSDAPLYLTKNALEPVNKSDGDKLIANKSAVNDVADAGAFASAHLSDVKIFLESL